MKKIKIGQIGIGHNHGEAKMLAIRKFPELFEVVGYAEENEEWIKDRGNMAGYRDLPRLSVEEVIEQSDAVLIETDVWNLTETAMRCIRAGKHIHMDKPASGTLAEYKALLDLAKEKGLVVQLGYMYRYNPAIRDLLGRIDRGEVGEIYSINAEMSTDHPVQYRRWLKNFNGGIMYILGSHLVDLIVYMLGKPNRVTSFLNHTQKDGVDLADNTLAVLEYDHALARVYVSSVEVNGWGRRQFVVSGSNGTAQIMPIENEITMYWSDHTITNQAYEDVRELIPLADVPKDSRYDDMVKDFYDYVMGTRENPFTYDHDYAVQEVLDEIVGGVGFPSKNIHG
ncbi:MAG: Gfo/Idh/MocA family oxidoreductase [Clostridia bacterium]|nr:Gfo/Idh/MocA family oxidoreductase [Clostridia bacterium]